MLSRYLARLPIRGAVTVSVGASSSVKLPILSTDGKLDPSTYDGGGEGGASSAASEVSFNPVYTGSTLDHGTTGEEGESPQDVQAALEEVDLQKLQYDNNLSDVANPTTAFNNIKVSASPTVAGVVELATLAEADAGTTDGGDVLEVGGAASKLALTPDVAKLVYLNKYDTDGDTMAGMLTLPALSPTDDSHAARKKYVDDQITARITETTTVPTGNLLWVDADNGTLLADATVPVAGRLDKPFLKLAEAKASAVSGDTIVVLPGTYNERNLLKDGVNWYFMPGAKINHTSIVSGAIWDDGASYGTNGAVTCKIMGYGEFHNGSTVSSPASVFNISNASSNIYVECYNITNASTGSGVLSLQDGTSNFVVFEKITPSNGLGIHATGGTHNVRTKTLSAVTGVNHTGGTLNLYFDTITTTGYSVLTSGNGTAYLEGQTITGSSAVLPAVGLFDATSTFTAKVRKITGASDVTLSVGVGVTTKIIDAEIVNTKASATALAVETEDAATLTLKDCDMTVDATATNCIAAVSGGATTVKLHGYNRGNKPKAASITFQYGMFEEVS